MPYKSQAQAGLFHSPNSPVSPAKVKEWDAATKGKHLPKRVGQKPAALAKGGKLVDHGDHFKLHTAGGDVMTIAHRGLHPATLKHLRQFAEGGTVQKYATKGEVDLPPGTEPVGNESAVGDSRIASPEAEAADDAARGEGQFGAQQPAASKEAEDELYAQQQALEAPHMDSPGQEIKVGEPSPSDASALSPVQQGPKLGTEEQPDTAALQAAANPQLEAYGSAKVHKVTPEEQAQVDAQAAARDANVATQAAVAGDVEKMNEARQREERNLAAISDQKQHDINVKADQLRQDIENGKIDPNHYWHERGAGGRVMASLGLILSGLGSGLGGGPNMAMQVIQKNIDRDIDAQEKNLKTKESLLSDCYRQTGDLRLARQMAEHTLANVYLAQANTLAAKSSLGTVKQNAAVLNAQGKLALATKARQIADQQSVNDVNAANASKQDRNRLRLQQAKTAGEAALKTPREMQGAKISTLEASKQDIQKHMDDIEKGFNGPLGSLIARVPGAQWTESGANTIANQAMAHALSEKLATALGGGAATTERIKELTPLIPLPSDSRAVREQKKARLNTLIDTQLSAYRQQQGNVGFKVAPPSQFTPAAPTRKQ